MRRPHLLGVVASVFTAGVCKALIYTLGFLVLLLCNFFTKPGGDIGNILTTALVTLVFTSIVLTFITVVIGLPIALVFWAFGFTRKWAFLVAPAIGVAPIVLMASSVFAVSAPTYLMIIAFAYFSSAIMWLLLGRSPATPSSSTPAQVPGAVVT